MKQNGFDFNAMMHRMNHMPDPIDPVPGVKYVAEFVDDKNSTVALTWYTHDKTTWKSVLEAVRKLPSRAYNGVTKKWEVPWNAGTMDWLSRSGWPEPTAFEKTAKREDPRIRQKALIDETKLDPEGTLIPGLRPYQVDFLKFAQLRHGRLALGDEMGCICGDSIVHIRVNGKAYAVTLQVLYRYYLTATKKSVWEIRCRVGADEIGYGEIVDVVNSGERECILARYEDGTYLVATPDHRVLTDGGWVELKDTVGMDVHRESMDGAYCRNRVVSVTALGLRPTYDVKVLNYGNFIADGTMVHNCGKTVEALSWMVYANAYPALYVVNAPTKLQWQGAYRKWVGATRKHYPDVDVISGRKPFPLSRDKCYIINWDILSDWKETLLSVGFRLLVGDEVQAIGNYKSKRASAFVELAKAIPHVIGMSGTPAMSKPLQFWTLLNIVEPTRFKNYYGFANRYCNPQTNEYGTTYNGASHVEELHELLVGCMLRRTKDEVMKDLPSKVVEVIPLEVDQSAMAEYRDEESATFSTETKSGDKESARNKVAHLLRSAYALKENSMLLWLEDFLESSDRKILLFAWHRSVVEVLFDKLKKYNPVMIYGGMSAGEREASRLRFIEDPKCRVVVANIQAGGVGIDGWQEVCHNVMFAEFAHTPNLHNQATDRLHRGGQTKSVTAYYLTAPGTIDDDALEVLDSRAKMMAGIMDGKEVASTDLLTEILERRGIRIG